MNDRTTRHELDRREALRREANARNQGTLWANYEVTIGQGARVYYTRPQQPHTARPKGDA